MQKTFDVKQSEDFLMFKKCLVNVNANIAKGFAYKRLMDNFFNFDPEVKSWRDKK